MTSMKPRSDSRPSGRMVVIAFGVAAAAAVALIAIALFLRDDGGSSSAAPAVDLSGIPQAGTLLGSPDASVLLIEYADLQCPYCRAYSEDVFPAIVEEYVRPGKVRTEFRGLAFLGPDSEKALRLVLAASLQGKGWELQEALFRNQGDENAGWVTDDLVRELAAEIPALDVDRVFADADGAEVTALVEKASKQGQADEVPGTPTFFIQIGDSEPYRVQVALDPAAFRPALDDALRG